MTEAAALLGVLGGASWFSRIGLGVVLDRVHVRYITAVIFLIVAIGCGLIAAQVTGVWLTLAAVMIGLGMGAETDLLTYTSSRYFAPRALSRALGASWIFFAWGSALGVFAGSLSYDLTGSYAAALFLYIACAIASMGVILLLGPYRHGGDTDAAQLGVPVALSAEA